MYNEQNFAFLQKMLGTCYPLHFWTYDAQMNLLPEQTEEDTFIDRIITANGMKEMLCQAARMEQATPVELVDEIGIVIGAVFSLDAAGNPDRILLLGPSFCNDQSFRRFQEDLNRHELSIGTRRHMLEYFRNIPILSIPTFQQYLLMMHHCIREEVLGFEDIRHSGIIYEQMARSRKTLSSTQQAFREELGRQTGDAVSREHLKQAAYHLTDEVTREHAGVSGFEQQIVSAVEQGNIGLLSMLNEGAKFSDGIRAQLDDDIQRHKYSSISLLTLCSRAAIRGGLSAPVSYSLMDTYTLAIDQCMTVTDIMHINDVIFTDYVTRVHAANTNPQISSAIRTCVDYINLHIREKISVEVLADLTGYSEYYLTKKFKKEMGISLNQYIQQEKLNLAKTLLGTEQMTITDIAELLHFCSQSYFTTAFTKQFGISPSQYRENR